MIIDAQLSLIQSSTWWLNWRIKREHSFNREERAAYSYALFCPKCQIVWFKHLILGNDLVWPKAQFCEDCAIVDCWHPIPGSILIEEGQGVIDDSLLAALPADLLDREVKLHLKALDNGTIEKSDALWATHIASLRC